MLNKGFLGHDGGVASIIVMILKTLKKLYEEKHHIKIVDLVINGFHRHVPANGLLSRLEIQ
jgi:hypothetical protein